jgi:hypothetical protein
MAMRFPICKPKAFRGIVYYTSEHDGYHVVTTIAQGATGLPVRFEATLAETQKMTITVPGRLGDMSHMIELTRSGGKLLVTGPELPTNNVELASPEPSVD